MSRLSLNLGLLSSTGMVPALQNVDDHLADISICRIDDLLVDMLRRYKERNHINLDDYVAPRWDEVKWCFASGYPNRAKFEEGGNVISPMFEVVLECASIVRPGSTIFTLISEFPTSGNFALSGMSGGPIFAIMEDGTFAPAGIIYSGSPSGEEGERAAEAFLTDRDILIKGSVIDPEIFRLWLDDAGL